MVEIPSAKTPPAEAFAAVHRATKVKALADALEQYEIPAEDAKLLNPGQWDRLAKGLGINTPSATTVGDVIEELNARASHHKPPSAAMLNALKKPGAMAAAQALARQKSQQ
jgi:hypothetical protein